MYAYIHETGRGFFEGVCAFSNATAHSCDPPPPATHENRSPIAKAPTRCGSHTALPWMALYLGVDVDHHPPTARAPLANHPRIAPQVVHAPLKASHAGALLVGTRSLGGHDLTP